MKQHQSKFIADLTNKEHHFLLQNDKIVLNQSLTYCTCLSHTHILIEGLTHE